MMKNFVALLVAAASANAYFLVGHSNVLVTERRDPIVNPKGISSHVHTIQGGSAFGATVTTAQLRASKCSTVPIKEDKSNYWIPQLYFQWKNGTVSSLTGGMVTYYLFSDTPGVTTAFPDDFRMISGDTTLRTYNASSIPRQAVTFLCLDFNGVSKTYNEMPRGVSCPSGIRSQINFPSCWDGKNVDSADHKSHVAFLSEGVDKGSCTDPKFPVTLPRVFLEFYWDTQDWEANRQNALDPQQPFVWANGDATGNGYHADYYNGWDEGALQKVVDNCHCNPFGDPTCCSDQGFMTFNKSPPQCTIESDVDETVFGTLAKLPGSNPITGGVVAQPGGAGAASTSVGTKDVPPATMSVVASAPVATKTALPAKTSTAAPTATGSPSTGSSNTGSGSNSGSGSSGSSSSSSNSESNSSGSSSTATSSNSESNSSGSSSMPSSWYSGSSGSSSSTSAAGPSSSGSSATPSSGSGDSSSSSGSSGSNSAPSSPPKCKQRPKAKRVEGLLERAAKPAPNDTQSAKFMAHRSINRRWGRVASIH